MTGLGIYLADIAPAVSHVLKWSGILMTIFGTVGLLLSMAMTFDREPEAGKTLRYTCVLIAAAVTFFVLLALTPSSEALLAIFA